MQPTLNHFLLALALSSIINQMLTCVAGIRNSAATTTDGRRILHEPLFPIETIPPPSPVEPPPPPASPESDWPFFPQGPPVPILDQPRSPAAPTNLTSPSQSAAPPAHPIKRITIVVSVSIAALGMLSALAVFLYCHRVRHPTAESDKLVGNDAQRVPPDGSATPDGLYLGTMDPYNQRAGAAEPNSSPYHRLNSVRRSELHRPSPELQPLPPLTGPPKRVSPPAMSSDEDTLFYSPQGSIAETSESSGSSISRQILPPTAAPAVTRVVYTSNSTQSHRASPKTRLSNCSSDIKKAITTSAPPPPPPPLPPPPRPPMPPCIQQSQLQCAQPKTPSPPKRKAKFASPPSPPPNLQLPPSMKNPPTKAEGSSGPPPPPPPPPPPMLGKTQIPEARVPPMPVRPLSRPQYVMPAPTAAPRAKAPPLVVEANRGGSSSSEPHEVVDNTDNGKPRLKPLHWDKVRASSDRATVWDQLKSSSFQLNEDMIESLFCNSAIPVQKEATRRPVLLPVEQGNRVLDPKKSQNIAILLRALNVTREEVCEALLDGNQEGLGPELLETLVKMAPTKEEELKLRDYSGDLSKLGSAERFLKAVLDIPFAFKRVDAMLYRANFDAEVKYLRKSFETLEAACEELKNSRLFFKLLEAVLRTGNRMNVGTNRGEAKAFKLDTLLKLVDVKGTDGKTTLLHFVVQEIIRSEGSGSDHPPEDFLKKPHPKSKEEEFKKQGLRVVAGLSNELSNVKKSAGMDSDVLSSYVTKLERELEKIKLVLQLEKSCTKGVKFFEAMKIFLREAEDEILRVKAEEKTALAMVKEVTEYFHGDTAKEEAHPFRIFMVVRDFLLVLDQVCKEVGTMQDRVVVGSARSFRISANASLPVLNRFNNRKEGSSDDDSSLSS